MERGFSVRWINVAIGVWLFISAFIWTHTYQQFTNTWIVGLISAVIAAIAMRVEQARYFNAAIAVWLLISTWALSTTMPGTVWNNVLCAIAMFIVALVPGARVAEVRGSHVR